MVLLLKYFLCNIFFSFPNSSQIPTFLYRQPFCSFSFIKTTTKRITKSNKKQEIHTKSHRNTKIGTKISEKKINKTKQKQKQKETKSLQITVEFVSHISLKGTAILFNELKGNLILMCY